MVGYPYYTDNNDLDLEESYLSEVVVEHSKYFAYGFFLALVTTPSLAFADEIQKLPDLIPTPAPNVGPGPGPGGANVPTNTRNAIQGIIAIAGCGAAINSCSNVGSQAFEAASSKLSNVNGPSAIAVGTCLILAGYCAGKLTTKGVDKLLGFN